MDTIGILEKFGDSSKNKIKLSKISKSLKLGSPFSSVMIQCLCGVCVSAEH